MGLITGGPLEIDPQIENNFAKWVIDNLTWGADKVILIDGLTHKEYTKRALLDLIHQLIPVFAGMGLQEGDVIGLCSENRIEMALIFYVALYLGLTLAPYNFLYSEAEFQHIMSVTRPKIMITSPIAEKQVVGVSKKLAFIHEVIVLGDEKRFAARTLTELINSVPRYTELCPIRKIDPKNNIAIILSSSGTTGPSKGVSITHSNIYHILKACEERVFTVPIPEVKLLGFLPWFHMFGCFSLFHLPSGGHQLIFIPRFEDKTVFTLIQRYRVTTMFVVPPLMIFLAKDPQVDRYDLSSLRELYCGAAPLSPETELAVKRRLPHLQTVRQGYGMTEGLTLLIPEGLNPKQGSVGRVTQGTCCKVVDPDSGAILSANQAGELYFKGGQLMKGYYGNPEATRTTINADGFLVTGDIGYYDEDGDFFIVDRLKELIKYKGYQVAPADLEALLLTNDQIKDAAVIGVPDELCGEKPLGFVVKQPGASITESQVMEFVAARSSPAKRLHAGVRFVDEIPRNPSGKILRRKLRELVKGEPKSKL